MSRARLLRSGAAVRRALCIAACLALLVALFPASAPALVNDGMHLDVGAGESITLDGEHRYAESIVVHDGGVVRVGSSGSLILRAPLISLQDGGIITASGTSAAPNGGTIVLDCDTFQIATSGGSIVADGANATASTSAGSGGSIHIRAAKSAQLASGTVSASGGQGYTSTYYAKMGGNGGQVVIRSRSLTMSGTGTRVRCSGGNGGDNIEGTDGADGGRGGSIALLGGSTTFGPLVDASGGDGGDAVFHMQGEGGDGGPGGSVTASWCSRSGTELFDVSGGAAGSGNMRNGTPGADGTAASAVGMDAQFDASHTTDGSVRAESNLEYAQSWTWSFTAAGLPFNAWLCQDGFGLAIAFRSHSDTSHTCDVFIDTNGDGAATPQADDLWLSVSASSVLTEARGNGTTWTTQPNATGWSAVAGRRWTGTEWLREAEFFIPFSKLGITAGQAKTLRLSLGARPGTAPTMWPAAATETVPASWPLLASVDEWTYFRNVAPGVPPGGWDMSPLTATITVPAPDLLAYVRDHIAGMKPGTAQYRYSTDGGATWTQWLPGADTLTYWDESTTTVRADDVPLPDSMTNNRIQFRCTDMGGLTGTSPIVTVRKDASPPGGWTAFSPATVVRDTLTPDCTVCVRDVCSGLAVSTAKYRYSTDGGATWSAWTTATCTGTDGTTALQTITADDVQFQRNSATQNKIQFRVADLAGNLGTSAVYTVAIDAPILGLPPNGSFEVGLPGQVPSLWSFAAQRYFDGYPPAGLWSWSGHIVTGHAYDGQQAVSGRIWLGATGPSPLTGYARIQTVSRGDFSGVTWLELYMKDILAGENDPSNVIPWYRCQIDAVLSDGSATITRPLYINENGAVTDSRDSTSTGADGATWSRYVVPLADPALDETSMTVSVLWSAQSASLSGAPVWGETAVFAQAKVDVVRAVDAVAPTSSGSVTGGFWTPDATRTIAWSASDNAGLSAIEFWARNNPGGGFGPWTRVGECALSGYAAAGTTEVQMPGQGICEIYTIARDIDGNAEEPPSVPDDTCGVDEEAPGSWSAFQPSGWVATHTVDCSTLVQDPLSGVRSAPVCVGVTPDVPAQAAALAWIDARFLWAGTGTSISVVDALDMRRPQHAGSIECSKDVVQDLARAPGSTVVAACGNDGIVTLDASDPAKPAVLGSLAEAKARRVAAADLQGIPVALTVDGESQNLAVWDISDPRAPRALGSLSLDVPQPIVDVAAADGAPVAFCAFGTSLAAVDLSDPTAPNMSDSIELKDAAVRSIATDGRWVYAVDEENALWAVQWDGGFGSPQSAPVSGAGPIALADSHAYVVASGTTEFTVVEHAPPDEPFRESTAYSTFPATSVDATNGVVALAEGSRVALYVHGEPMWSFSNDGGATWSGWSPALNPLGDTSEPATLTAPAVPFGQDSADKNLVRFRVGDAVGWLAQSAPFAVRIDTQIGMPSISSPTHPTAAWSSNNDPAFSWTPPDDLSGIVGYSYCIAPDPFTEPDTVSEGSATATTYADVPDGSWYFRVRAQDAAGNWGAAAAKLVRIDTAAPTGTMAVAGGASYTATRTVSVDSTVTDALSGLVDMRVSTDGGATWGAWRPYATSVTATLPAGDGKKTVVAQYRDAAGNVLELPDTIMLDTTPPTVTSTTIVPHVDKEVWYAARDATATWTASDALSGVADYSWCVDQSETTVPDTIPDGAAAIANLTGLDDGEQYFIVRACDRAGNWGAPRATRLRVDATGPLVTVAVNGGAPYTNSVEVTVSIEATDPLAGVAQMRISHDGGASWSPWMAYEPDIPLKITSAEGTHTVAVEVADGAQPPNSTLATDSIILDVTPPTGTMEIAGGAEWTVTHAVSIDSTVTDALSGLADMRVSLDGGTTWEGWEPYSSSVLVKFPQEDGTKTVVAQYRDAAGNVLELSDDIKLDMTAPQIDSLTAIPHENEDAWYASRDATLTWTASDGFSGVAGYSWCIDHEPLTTPDETVDGTEPHRSVQLDDALWYFHVRALDNAGNWGPAHHRAIRVDCSSPTGSMAVDGGAAYTEDLEVSIDSTVTDTVSGVTDLRVSTDGGATWSDWQPYAGSVTATLPSEDGTKTVVAQYRDAAGNVLELADDIALESFRHLDPAGPRVDRWWGPDRFKTAVEISKNSFPRAEAVVIATGRAFPDALSASALAGALGGPLLLTEPAALPTAVRDEIARLGATRAYIVGGTGAVSSAVETQVAAIPGITAVRRLAGTDRYETASRVASEVAGLEGDAFCRRAFIARGDDFADALAAAPIAFSQKMPVLLVKPTELPDSTRNTLVARGISDSVIIGGTGAVSAGVQSAIGKLGVATERWSGLNRFDTAAVVARKAVERGWARWDFVGVAWGRSFPDALSGGVGAGAYRGVLLMTESTALPAETRSTLATNKARIVGARVFGGTGSISDGVRNEIATAIRLP